MTHGHLKRSGDWRAEMLARVRALIMRADPEAIEEVKWRKPSNAMAGVPVWSHAGIICTGETYKDVVKLTFANGAALEDPAGLFNASLVGNTRRAIDLRQGDKIDARALKALVRAAVALNTMKTDRPRVKAVKRAGSGPMADTSATPRVKASAASKSRSVQTAKAAPRLLSGGNPQIAKGYGDASVQAYIAAMPGWKQDVGRRLDALIVSTVPNLRKAVKWNSPLYGVAGEDAKGGDQGFFLGVHCFAKYVKVAFFRGGSLQPPPPGASKQKHVRYLDIREGDWGDRLDEAQLADWILQASRNPGERM